MKIKDFVELTVPHYILIMIIGPISAHLIASGSLPPYNIALVILSLSLAVLGFNSMNMIFDAKLDKECKPLRVIPSKRVSVHEVKILSFGLFALSIFVAFLTDLLFVAVLAIFIFFAFIYSYEKTNVKKYWFGSSFTGVILYGLVPIFSVYAIENKISWPFVFVFAALFAVVSNSKDLEDMDGESKLGIDSLPLRIGFEKTLMILMAGLIIIVTAVLLASFVGILNKSLVFGSLVCYMLIIAIYPSVKSEVNKLKYKNTLAKVMGKQYRDIVTQSNIVTVIVGLVLLIQLVYGIFSMIVL